MRSITAKPVSASYLFALLPIIARQVTELFRKTPGQLTRKENHAFKRFTINGQNLTDVALTGLRELLSNLSKSAGGTNKLRHLTQDLGGQNVSKAKHRLMLKLAGRQQVTTHSSAKSSAGIDSIREPTSPYSVTFHQGVPENVQLGNHTVDLRVKHAGDKYTLRGNRGGAFSC